MHAADSPTTGQQQLHTLENSDTAPYGFGSVTSTICQWTWEESHSSMYQVIDTKTSVPALNPKLDPEVVGEPAPAPLCCSLEVPIGKTDKLSQTVDFKRALYLAPAHPSQSPNSLADTETLQETLCLQPQISLKGMKLDSGPLQTIVCKQSC